MGAIKEAIKQAAQEIASLADDVKTQAIELIKSELESETLVIQKVGALAKSGDLTESEAVNLVWQRTIVKKGKAYKQLAATQIKGEKLAWNIASILITAALKTI